MVIMLREYSEYMMENRSSESDFIRFLIKRYLKLRRTIPTYIIAIIKSYVEYLKRYLPEVDIDPLLKYADICDLTQRTTRVTG